MKTFFVMILLALLGPQNVFAVDCKGFVQGLDGVSCYTPTSDFQVLVGNGFVTDMFSRNVNDQKETGTVQFNFMLTPLDPGIPGWPNRMGVFFQNINPWDSGYGRAVGLVLQVGESGKTTLLYQASNCDKNGFDCDVSKPDVNSVFAGTASLGYLAPVASWLSGLPAPKVVVSHVSGLSTDHLLPPALNWSSPVEASANGDQSFLFVIANPGTDTVTVNGTLCDNHGAKISNQMWVVPAHGSVLVNLLSPKTDSIVNGTGPGFGSDPIAKGDFFGWLDIHATGVVSVIGDTVTKSTSPITPTGVKPNRHR